MCLKGTWQCVGLFTSDRWRKARVDWTGTSTYVYNTLVYTNLNYLKIQIRYRTTKNKADINYVKKVLKKFPQHTGNQYKAEEILSFFIFHLWIQKLSDKISFWRRHFCNFYCGSKSTLNIFSSSLNSLTIHCKKMPFSRPQPGCPLDRNN